MEEFLRTINWRSTGFGIGFFICKIAGKVFPDFAMICEVLESVSVAGGLISTADAARVRSIVLAVDHLFAKDNVDPVTLAPIVPTAEVKP